MNTRMPRWDIFCRVIDNYGDIGVCWRLARQLAAEYPLQVRLWLDDLGALRRICPQAGQAAQQWQAGVELCRWPAEEARLAVAEVVIEAFGCELPTGYRAAMQAAESPPLWLNLEYLSAEDWVADCHGLPSLQGGGLRKFFFYPGFTERTGGLLREAGLLQARHAWQADPAGQQTFLAGLGVQRQPGERLISLFAYENPGLAGWLDALAAGPQPSRLLVPQGRSDADLQAWLGPLEGGDGHWQRGALSIQRVPFVAQDDYDRLLWSCDFNAVRGEDSFIRAQWAGRPMLWHIYRQEQQAHLVKLEAFLEHYCAGMPAATGQALRRLWQAWNAAPQDMADAWRALQIHQPALQQQAEDWAAQRAGQDDLAAALVQFQRNWL